MAQHPRRARCLLLAVACCSGGSMLALYPATIASRVGEDLQGGMLGAFEPATVGNASNETLSLSGPATEFPGRSRIREDLPGSVLGASSLSEPATVGNASIETRSLSGPAAEFPGNVSNETAAALPGNASSNAKSLPARDLFVISVPTVASHIVEWNSRMLPPDFRTHVINDTATMDATARRIDAHLVERVGLHGAWDAYEALQPVSFRCDLLRYMILWDTGGVYLDAKLLLQADVSRWASMRPGQTLSVCSDHHFKFTSRRTNTTIPLLMNGALSARKGCPVLLEAIRLIIETVKHRRYFLDGEELAYGGTRTRTLGITGPILLGYAYAHNASLGFQHQVRIRCVFPYFRKYGIHDDLGQIMSFDLAVHKRMKGQSGNYEHMFNHAMLYSDRNEACCPSCAPATRACCKGRLCRGTARANGTAA